MTGWKSQTNLAKWTKWDNTEYNTESSNLSNLNTQRKIILFCKILHHDIFYLWRNILWRIWPFKCYKITIRLQSMPLILIMLGQYDDHHMAIWWSAWGYDDDDTFAPESSSSHKIYGLHGLKHHMVKISVDVTYAGRDKQQGIYTGTSCRSIQASQFSMQLMM